MTARAKLAPAAGYRRDAETVMARLDALAACSETETGLTRRFLTPAHRAAIDLVAGWMGAAGMTTRLDPMGTLIGRREGKRPSAPCLMLGSHIDTVVDAGKYDGALGVIAAIACVARFAETGFAPDFAIEVVAFGDEEGSRFPITLTSSRALAGTLDPGVFAIRDAAGTSLGEAMRSFRLDPEAHRAAARRREDVLAYIELHIEQGPVLEAESLPVGVVTAIAGQSRFEVAIEGVAGHAGTVPMALRRDALAAAAECILAAEDECRARAGSGAVGTVGRIAAAPGAVNVIPGRAQFVLDVRAPADADRSAAVDALRARFEAVAKRRGVWLEMRETHSAASVACASDLADCLAQAVAAEGVKVRRLPSGAGHDAMAVAALCDVAMLFVRCRGGVSHHPDEHVEITDVAVALAVLDRFVRAFGAATCPRFGQ